MKKPIVQMVEPRPPRALSIEDFLRVCGVSPLSTALRSIDRHNLERVFLVLADETTLNCTSKGLDSFPLSTPVKSVGAACIAWDGSDWEFSDVAAFTGADSLRQVRRNCHLAYNEAQPPRDRVHLERQ